MLTKGTIPYVTQRGVLTNEILTDIKVGSVINSVSVTERDVFTKEMLTQITVGSIIARETITYATTWGYSQKQNSHPDYSLARDNYRMSI